MLILETKAESNMLEIGRVLNGLGLEVYLPSKGRRIICTAQNQAGAKTAEVLARIPGVHRVREVKQPYVLAAREAQEKETVVHVGRAAIGSNEMVIMAGPCAVEDYDLLLSAAATVAKHGAKLLRGGAYKPRTSPYSFQGLEKEGLKYLTKAARAHNLAVVTEVVDQESLEEAAEYVDMLQIGSRNMQNFRLLQAAGRSGKPILLKRGLSATVEEWLMAAEYILSEGNENVVLCERGIRTYEQATRNTLDLSAVALVKSLSHLPVIVDPSHATGRAQLVTPMSKAAIAAGADGIIVEMHPDPFRALCDGQQSLDSGEYADLMREVKAISKAMGRAV